MACPTSTGSSSRRSDAEHGQREFIYQEDEQRMRRISGLPATPSPMPSSKPSCEADDGSENPVVGGLGGQRKHRRSRPASSASVSGTTRATSELVRRRRLLPLADRQGGGSARPAAAGDRMARQVEPGASACRQNGSGRRPPAATMAVAIPGAQTTSVAMPTSTNAAMMPALTIWQRQAPWACIRRAPRPMASWT